MGSPQTPTTEQIAQLEKAGQLREMTAPSKANVTDKTATVSFDLPRQEVSLLRLTWE